MPQINNISNPLRDLYIKQLARKHQQLAIIHEQLDTVLDGIKENNLMIQGEQVASMILDLGKKLAAIDTQESSETFNIISFKSLLRKIDFKDARDIAEKLHSQFQSQNLGAAVFLLQKSRKQMGEYCLDEMLSTIFKSDIQDVFSKKGNLGNYHSHIVGGDDVHEKTALGFLQKISENNGITASEDLFMLNQIVRKSLYSSLRSGDRLLILVKDFHISKDSQSFASFVTWFLQDFWKPLLDEIQGEILKHYGRIKIIAVLTSPSIIDEAHLETIDFGNITAFNPCQILDIPLSDWSEDDIESWLMEFQRMSLCDSKKKAQSIYNGSDGTPQTICNTLQDMADEQLK